MQQKSFFLLLLSYLAHHLLTSQNISCDPLGSLAAQVENLCSNLHWWDKGVVSLQKMSLSGCCYPSPSCLDSTTDLIWLDWWQLWRERDIPFHTQLISPEGWKEEYKMYSGMVGKGSEVTHQQCGGRRPRPTPSHLPGQRRPSLRWSAWATMLTGRYNKEKKIHKYIHI